MSLLFGLWEYISLMYNKKFSKEPTDKQKLGEIGENYACDWLEKNGYRVIERNYLKKWGEIDIITKKLNTIHFIEVKTVTRDFGENVTRVTENDKNFTFSNQDEYRAEDNMHPWKLKRLGRAVQSYLLERDVSDETEWQFDLVTVHIDQDKGLQGVFLLEDIVL